MVHPRDTGRLRRSLSRPRSVARSDTTYHSFHDVELFEPASPRNGNTVQTKPPQTWRNEPFAPSPMRRQDSGYESIPSGSKSDGSHGSGRRTSTGTSSSTSSSHQTRPRTRPSIHRATRSTPTPYTALSSRPASQQQHQQQHSFSYFHFPNPDASYAAVGQVDPDQEEDEEDDELTGTIYPPPPQTTHYWTSDHTRRLEYAAIDAASQGVKGWMLKHMVPDCFIPKENRRLRFDDDTGSVRRYRLELDDDCFEKKESGGRKLGWRMFGRSHSTF
ncbi:hypothetical protein PG987_001464 [Apiospora arundinis]